MPTLDARIDNVVAGDDIQITRTITLVPANETLTDGWLTVKEHPDDLDADAIIDKQITPTDAPGTGQITDTGADGTGAVRFDLADTDTSKLTPGRDYYWDIQVKTSGGAIYTPTAGKIRTVQGRTADIA
ncbi:hypothetical protein LCGC14_0907600 [marine sediment metagenome]|uniref:BppU N-terminal domain-containing protein n=1 Tax=marine sediment metagenome TaxID=412755 RepID=A0A0F9S1F3_9ZZZZ